MGLYTICDELIKGITEEIKNNDSSMSTGYRDLDPILMGGFKDGQLYVLASRPGMGKSTLAMNIAMNILKGEKKIVYFTIESTMSLMLSKMICLDARIETGTTKDYTNEELDYIDEAAKHIAGMNLIINDDESLDIDQLYGVMSDYPCSDADMIIIDYLQLMTSPWDISGEFHASHDDEMEYICRRIKLLAKKLDIPILVLSQLSKNADFRNDKHPEISDLIEPVGMDAYADVIMFLYRDDHYNKDSELRGIAEINIAKNHFGGTGVCRLVYIMQMMKFANIERK